MSLFKLLNELMAIDVIDDEPASGSGQAQGCGEMSFTHTGWAGKYDVFTVFKKPHGGQFFNLPFFNGRLEAEIKVAESFFIGKKDVMIWVSTARFCL